MQVRPSSGRNLWAPPLLPLTDTQSLSLHHSGRLGTCVGLEHRTYGEGIQIKKPCVTRQRKTGNCQVTLDLWMRKAEIDTRLADSLQGDL